jgi:hypothetical protein
VDFDANQTKKEANNVQKEISAKKKAGFRHPVLPLRFIYIVSRQINRQTIL